MSPRIFWIGCEGPGRLAILSRPSSEWLAEEVAAWRQAGVAIAVSLLEWHEQAELGLLAEAEECRARGIEFVSFPIADYGVPASRTEALTLARRLAQAIRNGSVVGVHCRGGIGRSGMMAACVLMARGQSSDAALAAVSAARGVGVPETPEQRDWIGSVQASTPQS